MDALVASSTETLMIPKTVAVAPTGISSTYQLSDGGRYGGAVALQFSPDGSFAGTGGVISARVKDSGLAWLPIPYLRWNVNSVASDWTPVSAAITQAGLFQIPCPDGFEIAVVFPAAGITAGTMTIAVCGAPVR